MEVKVSIHQSEQPIAILKITGDINASNFMEVVNKAQELFDNPARNLIIDLSEVPSISSTGLVALHKIALVYSGVPQQVEADKDEIRPDFTHSSNARKYVKLAADRPGDIGLLSQNKLIPVRIAGGAVEGRCAAISLTAMER